MFSHLMSNIVLQEVEHSIIEQILMDPTLTRLVDELFFECARPPTARAPHSSICGLSAHVSCGMAALVVRLRAVHPRHPTHAVAASGAHGTAMAPEALDIDGSWRPRDPVGTHGTPPHPRLILAEAGPSTSSL